jgi:hypothetical protein
MWKDGQTDMMKLTVAFLNFANTPKKELSVGIYVLYDATKEHGHNLQSGIFKQFPNNKFLGAQDCQTEVGGLRAAVDVVKIWFGLLCAAMDVGRHGLNYFVLQWMLEDIVWTSLSCSGCWKMGLDSFELQ